MSAYRPKSAPSTRPFEYTHAPASRLLASVVMTAGSALPLLLITRAVYTLMYAIYHLLPPVLTHALLFLLSVTLTSRVLQAVLPTSRPATAAGCPADAAVVAPRRVAVIGAGVTGLLTAKELLAEGHSVTVFETAAQPGGVWCAGAPTGRGRVWAHTVSSSSALNSAMSDLPLQSYFENQPDPFHVSQARFAEYIQEYVETFALLPFVRLRTTVVGIVRSAADQWLVSSVGEAGVTEEVFDFLAVCTGQVQLPRRPAFEGQGVFAGEVLHVADVTDVSRFDGRNVVCVGIGETGSDISEAVSKVSKSFFLSIRNPFICLSRNLFGVPPDFYETRSVYVLPFWARYAIIKTQLLFVFLLKFWDSATPCGTSACNPNWRNMLTTVMNRQYVQEVFKGERSMCNSLLVTKTERYLYAVDSGACVLKPGVDRLDRDGVHFKDGSYAKCDVLLCCTGYTPDVFPWFGENCRVLASSKARSRYMLSYDVEYGSSVGFFGFCRGQAGSVIMPSEMQARWFALLVSGKRRLPSEKMMRRDVMESRRRNDGYFGTLGGWFLANQIARWHVGCEPNVLRICFRHGPVVAWRVFTQSFAAYMFRFEGPHAEPELATRVYSESVATCGKPLPWHFLEGFTLGLGVVFDVLSQLPVVGKSALFEPLINRW